MTRQILHWKHAAIGAALLTATAPFSVVARPPVRAEPASLERLDALAARLARRDAFSGVVLIAHGDRIVFERAYGLADRSRKTPVAPNTAFYLASSGKMFTAVAILQLVEAGKVSLDDPVGRFLPDYPDPTIRDKVTVRMLLTHRGGTGGIDVFGPEGAANRAWVRTLADYVTLAGRRAPEFPPGSQQSYSNYGFILLGRIVEVASGQSFYDYVDANIFRPAGMTRSGFPLRDAPAPGVAVGYSRIVWQGSTPTFGTRLIPNTAGLPWRGTSAGGGVANARDLFRFVTAVRDGRLLSRAMLARAIAPESDGGWGFVSDPRPGHGFWGHGGGADGMNSDVRYYPASRTTIVVLANRDPQVANQIAAYWEYRQRDPRGTAPLYLQGTMNGWKAIDRLRARADGTMSAVVWLPAGTTEFKVASPGFDLVDLGADQVGGDLRNGARDVPMVFVGGNFTLKTDRPGRYRFMVSGWRLGDPRLAVRRLP